MKSQDFGCEKRGARSGSTTGCAICRRVRPMKGTPLAVSIFVVGSLLSGCQEWLNGPPADKPPPAQDDSVDVSAEKHHKKLVENEYTRAYKVEIEPDEATAKHRHGHDYVTITYGYAEVTNEVEGKPPSKVTFNDGDVKYQLGHGPPHVIHNTSQTTFRNITIEVLKDADKAGLSKWDPDHGTVALQNGTREILFANAVVRVSRIDLAPGGSMPKGQLQDHALFVAESDLDLRDDSGPRDANNHSVHLAAGETKWENAGGQSKLTHRGSKPAKLVLLEFM
jgi:quercetin dioxygenase-like cupin family protein